ncbi:hypothetical protein ACTXT7_008408 [Hymenolepis weldensis]
MQFTQLIVLVILVLCVCDVQPRGNRPKVRTPSKVYPTTFSKMKMSSGLSLNRKHALLAAGGLASVYIGFKLASHRDLSRYTICEGPRHELGERCCAGQSYNTYSPSLGKIIGSLFGILMAILGIGLVAYFCCPQRYSESDVAYSDSDEVYSLPTPHHQLTPNGIAVTIGGYTPAIDPQLPTYPVPVGPNPSYYPY